MVSDRSDSGQFLTLIRSSNYSILVQWILLLPHKVALFSVWYEPFILKVVSIFEKNWETKDLDSVKRFIEMDFQHFQNKPCTFTNGCVLWPLLLKDSKFYVNWIFFSKLIKIKIVHRDILTGAQCALFFRQIRLLYFSVYSELFCIIICFLSNHFWIYYTCVFGLKSFIKKGTVIYKL